MRALAVEKYLETKSFDAAIRDFVTKFNPPKPPYKSLIVKWVAKFRTEGTVRNPNSITLVEKVTQDERESGMRSLSSAFENPSKNHLTNRRGGGVRSWLSHALQC